MRVKILLFCIVVFGFRLNAQVVTENLQGVVSFISSQNVYVKFKSTTGLSEGDTLFISAKGVLVPVLKISNLSSSSCVCTFISNISLLVSDQIIAKKNSNLIKPVDNEAKALVKETQTMIVQDSLKTEKKQSQPEAYHYRGKCHRPDLVGKVLEQEPGALC